MRLVRLLAFLCGVALLAVGLTCKPYLPPTPAAPSGPAQVWTGIPAEFSDSCSNASGALRFQFDCGDGLQEMSDFMAAGSSGKMTHAWAAPGQYDVRVMAENEQGSVSDWSPATAVTVRNPDTFPSRYYSEVITSPCAYVLTALPNGAEVYLAGRATPGLVTVLRTSDNTVVDTIAVGDGPVALAALPNSEYVYTANRPSKSVSVIRASDHTVVTTIPMAASPYALAASPDGQYVYVTLVDSSRFEIIRTSDNTVVQSVKVLAGGLRGITVSPDGQRLYVVCGGRGDVRVIRTSDYAVIDSLHFCDYSEVSAVVAFGDRFYVASRDEDRVYALRATDDSVIAAIQLHTGSYPQALVALPGEEYIYAGCTDGITIIRTADNRVVAPIPLWETCDGLAVLPSGDCVYATHGSQSSISLIGY